MQKKPCSQEMPKLKECPHPSSMAALLDGGNTFCKASEYTGKEVSRNTKPFIPPNSET